VCQDPQIFSIKQKVGVAALTASYIPLNAKPAFRFANFCEKTPATYKLINAKKGF
jgi:hypothetical protein